MRQIGLTLEEPVSAVPIPPLGWHPGLTTGFEHLDAQHQALFDNMRKIEDAARQRSMIRTCYFLGRLNDYAREHFADEERLMRRHKYPGLASHIREHRDFAAKLRDLGNACLHRDVSDDLMEMLRSWLVRHVATSDMEYVPYLARGSRGTRPRALASVNMA